MSDPAPAPAPGEDRFTAADLEPSSPERLPRVDSALAIVGALASASYVGGLVAMGACAAPAVFGAIPRPVAGLAMGAAFARFDQLALGLAVAGLVVELGRTGISAACRVPASVAVRLRRGAVVITAAAVALVAFRVSPTIRALHAAGAVRGEGADGAALEQAHQLAELLGKVGLGAALVAAVLHMVTQGVARRASAHDPDDEAEAPLPPGPAA